MFPTLCQSRFVSTVLVRCSRAQFKMANLTASGERPLKRPRVESTQAAEVRTKRAAFLSSLSRAVSPPSSIASERLTDIPPQRFDTSLPTPALTGAASNVQVKQSLSTKPSIQSHVQSASRSLPSPFQLTKVFGLPSSSNVDTISLHDILGDPLIREAWIFNFCFDVDWTMKHFDEDVRELVNVKIVHGSWKRDDMNKMAIEEDLKKWKNAEDIKAYLPDNFGTHHSKMMILFKHDDTAQVIIHTANMLEIDWDHMTQAVWRSPALPLKQTTHIEDEDSSIGSGNAFKHDLLRYLKAYGGKLKSLVEQLLLYDFSSIRAVLVASVPSHVKVSDPADKVWGHLALSHALKAMRQTRPASSKKSSHLVCQVSSIATLPQAWLSETIYKAALCNSSAIIFPTPADLRNALSGYQTGGSIHTKISSPAHLKQISLLRPQLHRWGTRSPSSTTQAKRHLIPPHIKTYISFNYKPTSEQSVADIEWALLTSANLSTQAWGTAPKVPKGARDPQQGVVHIQSFEIGVLVWPELFASEGDKEVRMIPMFGKDKPDDIIAEENGMSVVGLRMPYDLPPAPYKDDELPWSPSVGYDEPDVFGRLWRGASH